jgi:hypothetical protein
MLYRPPLQHFVVAVPVFIVKVVLRHFHRHCPRAVHCDSLLEELRSLELTTMEETRWT